jgi:pyridoxine 5-phosphate synthase
VIRLGVNIDHVATLRQARRAPEPDPVHAAVLAEMGGASGITVHLRSDRRHIQDRDIEILKQVVKTRLNVEMAGTQEMVRIALTVKPDQVTLVPERREELTTEGGLDAIGQRDEVRKVTRALRDGGIEVSLFIDPDLEQIKASHRADAQAVELHTGRYCEARGADERKRELSRLLDAAKAAAKLGLRVAAGHGLDYWNVTPVARIEEIGELNIGYAIVCRAVLVGLERAVRDMKELIVRPGRA